MLVSRLVVALPMARIGLLDECPCDLPRAFVCLAFAFFARHRRCKLRCKLERREGRPRISASKRHNLRFSILIEHILPIETLRRRNRTLDDLLDIVVGQKRELDDTRARKQGRVHLEVGIFCRCADKNDRAVLDSMEQRILLAPAEAVDLVDEEDCALPLRKPAVLGI